MHDRAGHRVGRAAWRDVIVAAAPIVLRGERDCDGQDGHRHRELLA
jgi:hypothetical protein